MGVLTPLKTHPTTQALLPLAFLVLALIIALPPFALHLFLHPLPYLNLQKPLAARLHALRAKFFYYVWRVMSPLLDPGDAPHKAALLPRAHGTVLEIGAGVGDNIKYYAHRQVARLVLVEPNSDMHPRLRAKANAAGYVEGDGSLLLLGCGGAATDAKALALAGVGEGSVDCVMAIHVLCGIPGPAAAIELYRRLLKPGGQLVFYEHVRSAERGSAEWQEWYTRVIWQTAFDGCCMDRPTGAWIVGGSEAEGAGKGGLATGMELVKGSGALKVKGRWQEVEIMAPEGQEKFALLPHVMGWAVKA